MQMRYLRTLSQFDAKRDATLVVTENRDYDLPGGGTHTLPMIAEWVGRA